MSSSTTTSSSSASPIGARRVRTDLNTSENFYLSQSSIRPRTRTTSPIAIKQLHQQQQHLQHLPFYQQHLQQHALTAAYTMPTSAQMQSSRRMPNLSPPKMTTTNTAKSGAVKRVTISMGDGGNFVANNINGDGGGGTQILSTSAPHTCYVPSHFRCCTLVFIIVTIVAVD